MADKKDNPAEAAKAGNGAQPSLNILAQYVKDLSFESPGAPNSLRGRENAPGININVNVNANPISDTEFDVNLTINAKAGADKDVLFNVELVYGGVFRLNGFPQEHTLPILFIECPRLLFPSAVSGSGNVRPSTSARGSAGGVIGVPTHHAASHPGDRGFAISNMLGRPGGGTQPLLLRPARCTSSFASSHQSMSSITACISQWEKVWSGNGPSLH